MWHDEIDRNGAYPPLTRGRKAKKHRITDSSNICAKRGILRYNRRSYNVKLQKSGVRVNHLLSRFFYSHSHLTFSLSTAYFKSESSEGKSHQLLFSAQL